MTEQADHPDFPSGDWVGFYQQGGSRCRTELRLRFHNRSVSGAGADAVGEFTIRGRFDPETREVNFIKRYLAAHDVYYRGFRETRGIWGVWEIGSTDRAGFHIWPRAEGEEQGAEAAEEIEAPVQPSTMTFSRQLQTSGTA